MSLLPKRLKLEQVRFLLRLDRGGSALSAPITLAAARNSVAALLTQESRYASLLLRAIAGLISIVEGRIVIAGDHVATADHHWPVGKRSTVLIPRDESLFPHLTVKENLLLAMLRVKRRERVGFAAELLAQVEIDDCGDYYPYQLTRDVVQRATLARALATSAPLLLWDEPFTQAHPSDQIALAALLQRLTQSYELTTLLVTANQEALWVAADEAGVLDHDQLLQWDTPYNLYHAPGHRRVADAFGPATFLKGFIQRDGRLNSEIGGLQFQKPPPELLWNQPVEILVRPDDIHWDKQGLARGLVLSKRFQGAESRYRLQLDEGSILTLTVPSHTDIAVGQLFPFRVEMDHLMIFTDQSDHSIDLGVATSY